MGLCDNHHAQEQEDDAVTGGGKRPINISILYLPDTL